VLNPKLNEIAEKIRNEELRKKVLDFLENPTFELNGKVYSGPSFDVSPGGITHHHTYEGGYIEHVVATEKLAWSLCDIVEQVYGGAVNRDYVAAGVLLHDIFKPVTYMLDERGEYTSAAITDYLDHIALATSELVRRNFPLELVHIVAVHYGTYGIVKPRTIEALILHLSDNTDSQLNGQVLNAAEYLTRKATGETLPKMNSKEAFEIVRSKAAEGWEGVEKSILKIRLEREPQKP
jgi:7,8-dihydroneopterin 2',3'-cyclic phosphate phosphodiesterase